MSNLAYLDAASGSMLLQAILGGAAGLAVTFKVMGGRLKRTLFFWRRGEDAQSENTAESSATTPGA
jgi:hypothetical protein